MTRAPEKLVPLKTGASAGEVSSPEETTGPNRLAFDTIRDDIGSEEPRRCARRERDGRVSARLIAIANALEGMDRASAARPAGMDRQTS